ncbi:murein hydrolase activator EnvC family protein [Sandaracinus amylolyticus]|uniref:Periplasmic septal ring factor with murein hydrolase activity EnvC/YibP n=1 Tax=Sandaracinus amylolyticus TaxID=927083 RepID=A0A0F6SFY9_9BACT|nr:M23 family metallopeptidase [Sandaracinus amylolyticus]AKF07774.1 Periplasmic septal ring factor with murein hydrolase activity EnvC/YibP [Sandaracinus amylolyticus]
MRRRALTLLLALGLAVGSAPRDARGQDDTSEEAPLPLDPVQRLAALEERIASALSEAEHASTDHARVETEIAGLTEGRAAANRRVRERTRALYRMTRAGVLPLAGGLDSMLAHVARVERLERMLRHDLEALSDLRARAAALRAEAGRLAERMDTTRARVAQLEAQKGALEEDVRRAMLYGSAFSDATFGTSTSTSAYGLRAVDAPATSALGFESHRGELALPLAAPRAIREATREQGAGIELDGVRGAPVRCAADGRVAFSDRHPSYGRMIIVDHGEGHFTIYGGLARSDVQVGAPVTRGATLGAVDTEPLFFQVRRGTRPLDARTWLGL